VEPTNLPDGLELRIPHHTYVLATLKGSRMYYNRVEEEVEPKEGAAMVPV
jgi:hypothetical protein